MSRFWNAVGQLKFEMLDQNGSCRKLPVTIAGEAYRLVCIRNAEPALLERPIRPKRNVQVVGNDPGADTQRAWVRKNSRLSKRGGQRRADRLIIIGESFDCICSLNSDQNITVAWIS